MSSWQETCAVTRVPIFKGTSVVMIVPATYNKVYHDQWLNEFYHDQWFNEGFPSSIDKVDSIHRGTYNDYGWINELKQKKGSEHTEAIFVRDAVWKEIVGSEQLNVLYFKRLDEQVDQWYAHLDKAAKLAEQENTPFAEKDPTDRQLFREFYKVKTFASLCRINLPDAAAFRGTRSSVDRAKENYSLLTKLVQNEVNKL